MSVVLRVYAIRAHLASPADIWSRSDGGTSPQVYWLSTDSLQEASPHIGHLPSIAFDFSGACAATFDDVLGGHWPSLDILLSTLPALRKIVFAFTSQKHKDRFWKDVLDIKKSHMVSKLECQCVIRDHVKVFEEDTLWMWKHFFIPADSTSQSSSMSVSTLSPDRR